MDDRNAPLTTPHHAAATFRHWSDPRRTVVDVILSREDGEGSQNTTDRSLRSFASLRMTGGTLSRWTLVLAAGSLAERGAVLQLADDPVQPLVAVECDVLRVVVTNTAQAAAEVVLMDRRAAEATRCIRGRGHCPLIVALRAAWRMDLL
jgi:hypothetical protein